MSEEALRTALAEGSPPVVAALIGNGADIHYKAEEGYDALIDAVHGRDVTRDPRMLDLLALLVAHGVDLSGVSADGESGLRVLSRLGRFDAVRLLLNAGADGRQLEWTPLMEAVALGSVADVQAALRQEVALEERDWWSRTAWLIAVLTGDIAKARLLRDWGADTNACGRCGCPSLFYAIQGHHADMLRWLLAEGADVHQSDEFGTTALIEAVECDDRECVEILLASGADVDVDGTALSRAQSRHIIMRLLDAGADPANLTQEGQRLVLGLPDIGDDALATITLDDFRRNYTRSFGKSNPERMRVPFWEAMIRCGVSAYAARSRFKAQHRRFPRPVWSAERFGQSLTLLADGRAIQIGGEHEDSYDPDFCIYNDVIVHEPNGEIAIYGYPESLFPSTDFHTATLVGDCIYIIGSLGYQGTRRPGVTPVFRLDVRTLRIDPVATSGELPGWIHRHRAVALSPHAIRISKGSIIRGSGRREVLEPNPSTFVLDLNRLLWTRE
jgi:ankyrin repeat protein